MRRVKNERGMALAMVLVFSVICLAVMAALIYMVTSGTKLSGGQKRYYSAVEAAKGGADIVYQAIGAAAGDDTATIISSIGNFLKDTGQDTYLLSPSTSASPTVTPATCTGTSSALNGSLPFTGFATKLKTSSKKPDGSANWSSNCNWGSIAINPSDNSTYDMQFVFQGSSFPGFTTPTYGVYAKIVDTVEGGVLGSSSGLRTGGTTSQGGGGAGVHYFYTIEIDAENLSQPVGNRERAKVSVLFQY